MQCPICHDESKIVIMEKRLNIYRCNSCLHTFTDVVKGNQEKYGNDYFWESHKNWFNNPNYQLFDFIYKKFLKLLGKKECRLLDVGCGNGDFLKYVSGKNSTVKLFGIDLTYNQHPYIHFIKSSFYDLKEEEIGTKFNVICSLATIEHIDNIHLFMQKINNLLESGGFLFIMTVNNNGLIYRIARLLNKVGVHIAYDRLYSHHHLQHYTNKSLKKLVEMNGFKVLLKKNHSFPIKAVDVPKNNFLIEKIYKFIILLIFFLSSILRNGMLQTIICVKKN